MFKTTSSVLSDVASISSGVSGTILNSVLLVDDCVLLGRDQIAIWRHTKRLELEALGIQPTNSASAIRITTPQG